MRPQVSASQTATPPARTVPAPPLKKETVRALARMLGKIRQVVRFERVTPFEEISAEDRAELEKDARVAIHSQDPVRARMALEAAKNAAEGVLADCGFVPSRAGQDMARRIAATAVLTHRLALEGVLDQELQKHLDGGVQ